MLEYAGTDATNVFKEKPHSSEAIALLEQYIIGELMSWYSPLFFKYNNDGF